MIIGSGPCGIIATRYLKEKNNVICIENKEDIGGQWLGDPYTENDHPSLAGNSYFNDHSVL